MSCTERVIFAPEVSRELDGEIQCLMKQSGLSAPDLLQSMVILYKRNTMLHEPETIAALQQMETLVKRLDDQYTDNHYIPTTVLLQQTQAELIAVVKKFLNTLSPGDMPAPKPPRVHGLLGY